MGRSVSYPSGAHVAYSDWEAGWVSHDPETDEPLEEGYWDEDQAHFDWECIVDNFKHTIKVLFPSTWEIDKWVGREDRALMANNYCYFGISEYCGCIAYWVVLRDDLGWTEGGRAEHWFKQIEHSFEKAFATMYRIGGFSDGTSVYNRIAA